MWRIAVFFCCCITGCAPVYIPNARNTPLFDAPGEVQASVGIGTSYDVQVAYAATKNIGLMTNYAFVSRPGNLDMDTENTYKNRSNFGEVGIGYIKTTLIESGLRNTRITEVWTGAGLGKGLGYYERTLLLSIDTLSTSARFQRYFVQPTVGIRNKNWDLIFTGRFTFVNYSKANIESTQYNSITFAKTNGYFEPSAAYRLYFSQRRIMLTSQAGFNISFIHSDSGDYLHLYPWSGSVSLGVKLQPKKMR